MRETVRPWLADVGLAGLLMAISASTYAGQTGTIPVSAALAGTVVVRRRFPVAALAATLAIGTAQVIVGVGPGSANSSPQLTFADVAILVLLYTVAAGRPRWVSLAGLAACAGLSWRRWRA